VAIRTEDYYRKYGPMVLRRCRRLLRDEQCARDAMQDVFVKVLSHQDRLEDRAPSSLLFRMATHVCLNKIRDEGRRPRGDDGALARIASARDEGARAQARSILARLFRREQVSSRAMAVMHWLDGMTLEEVAGEVGLSVSAVRKRLRGLRARLGDLKEIEA